MTELTTLVTYASILDSCNASQTFIASGRKIRIESVLDELNKGRDKAAHKKKKTIKILLAEDNELNQALVETLVQARKWDIDIVDNGKKVLESLESKAYDLILMDIQMPVMSGIEATLIIRQQEKATGKHIPIIAVTTFISKEDKARCTWAGMDDFIPKPIDTEQFYLKIQQAVCN